MSATQHPTPAPDTVQRLRSALLLLLAWAEAAEDPETTLDPERDRKRRRLAIAQARAVLAHVDPHAAGIRPAVKQESPAVLFFMEHAGLSWDPKRETEAEGRLRCAREAADAERWAHSVDMQFSWDHEAEPADRSGIDHEGPLWSCIAYLDGEVVASLGCIDLGENGNPWSDPYARVIRAEMAAEARSQIGGGK